MKFQIVSNHTGRIRLRFGKFIFTKEQCYGMRDVLLSFKGITYIKTNEINGSLLIECKDESDKIYVLDFLSNLTRSDLTDGVPAQEEKNRELKLHFKLKVAHLCMKHVLRNVLIPGRINRIFAWYRALPFLHAGFKVLLKGRMTVELLDATAIGTSLCCGNYKTASSTMFLLSLSDLLLEYSNARAKNELTQSLAINIDNVWIIKNDVELNIPISELCTGDIIRVRKGSMIPVDGTIETGDALINEATMTGESLPVHKKSGSTVFAGTLIEDGEIDIFVTALGNQSRIAKIIDTIDFGEGAKAAVQGKAERMADGIVPVSFGLFLATLTITQNIQRALSVLMVDFSCAIKLTTPITVISSLKEASQKQIIIKGGKYLELLSEVDTVVFDKTGTLTNAVPEVSKIIVTHDEYTEEKVLRIAACLEEHFPHSLASAIVSYAAEKNLLHPENHGKVKYIVAHGIAGSYEGKRSVIGSRHFVFDDEGIPFPVQQEYRITKEIGSDSAVYLAVDDCLAGIICINDPPRDDAHQAIELLRKEGIDKIIMITGDSEGTAEYISNFLGLDNYYASVLPDGKAEIINALKAQGRTVLMVGDGINDTPALSCADVSLTLNGSSDIAREISDISVLSDDLTKIVIARRLAKGMMKKISDHYRFIVSFNTVLIFSGIFGLLYADKSALLHNASTVSLASISARPVLRLKKNTN